MHPITRTIIIATTSALAFIVATCTPNFSTDFAPAKATPATPTAPTTPTATPATPTPQVSAPSPTPADPAQLEVGRIVFVQYCHICHPGGGRGVGREIKGTSPDITKRAVRQGVGAMPAYGPGQINDQQLDALAIYVASLR